MVSQIKAFQHSRSGCHCYSKHSRSGYHGYYYYMISTFQGWLPRLLWLRYFNIREMVTMFTLIKAIQHSRTGYHS